MVELTGKDKAIDRRGFLKGSALFAAAAVGVGMAGSAFASPQDPAKKDEKPSDEKDKDKDKEKEKAGEQKAGEKSGEQTKKDTPAKQGDQARTDPNKLVDKDGREYRICERCGGNMYKEGNTWTCEQCGFSYVE